ncbi:MAG: phosphatase PAP2 family protein [Alphaproteobacteria bacterium]|nr:phosphatase PAP2 family protein [Alphaproteobacteria bacterium]
MSCRLWSFKRFSVFFAAVLSFLAVEGTLFLFVDKPLAEAAKVWDTTAHGTIDFFRSITDYAKGCWYLWPSGIAAILCAVFLRSKKTSEKCRRVFEYIGPRALFLFLAIAGSGIVVNILKPIFGRARPLLWLRDGVYGFHPFSTKYLLSSMPSGHSTTVFALAFVLAKLYPKGKILWFFYAFMLAFSRVAVGAHYASDVVAGGVLGGLTVVFFKFTGMNRVVKIIFPIDKREKID